MTSLISLLINEHAKLFKRKRLWVMLTSIVFIVILAGIFVLKFFSETNGTPEESSLWAFVSILKNVAILIGLFAISISCNIVTQEFSLGTIKFLMIRPVTRGKVLLSKYLTVLSLTLLFLLVLFVLSLVTGGMIFGFHTLPTDDVAEIVKAYLYSLIEIVMLATLAFMLSVLTRSNSLAMGLSIPLYLMGGMSNLLIARYEWSKYSLFVNLNLDMYDIGVPFKPGMTLGFSLAVLAVYYLIFLAVAFLVFKKRDIV